MIVNLFCNVCLNRLRAVFERGKGEVDAYILPCSECAAQQSVQSDKCPHCQHGLIVLPDKSVIDCIACGSTGIRR